MNYRFLPMIVQDMFKFIRLVAFLFSCVQRMICIFFSPPWSHHDFYFSNWTISWKCLSCFNTLFQTEVYWRILKSEEPSDNLKLHKHLFQILHHFCWIYTWTTVLVQRCDIPSFIWFCGKALSIFCFENSQKA